MFGDDDDKKELFSKINEAEKECRDACAGKYIKPRLTLVQGAAILALLSVKSKEFQDAINMFAKAGQSDMVDMLQREIDDFADMHAVIKAECERAEAGEKNGGLSVVSFPGAGATDDGGEE